MFRNGQATFEGGALESASIDRLEFRDAISELFELTVELYDKDPTIDPFGVVGKGGAVSFSAEPFVKRIAGIVRTMQELSSEPTGVSSYEVSIVPELWLTTRRRDNRIFRDATAIDIINRVAAGNGIAQPVLRTSATLAKRDYCVQYDETDYEFIMRLLAEEGIASIFDHSNESKWTLVDATPAQTSALRDEAIPIRPQTDQHIFEPYLSSVIIRSNVETSSVTVRDWDYTHPTLLLATDSGPPKGRLFDRETSLRDYRYAVGQFTALDAGKKLAAGRLEEARALRRVVDCTPHFLAPAGTCFTIANHPRDDVNVSVLVVSSTMIVQDEEASTYRAECIERTVPYRPPQRSKPRIYGTQTALVVTDDESEEIAVDSLGRVKVFFRWDERDNLNGDVTRYVRVSQGWASAGFGFTMLPRRGDEVIVAFLDGDPDEPIIVGRVHNATYPPPLNLPAEKTRSIWRSRSSPAPANGDAGFNEIMMEDQAGSELLAMHAQKDYTRSTNNSENITVGGSQATNVVGPESHSAHDVTITAVNDFIKATAETNVSIQAKTEDLTATAFKNVSIAATTGDMNVSALKNTGVSGGSTAIITSPVAILHGSALAAVQSEALATVSAPTVTVTGGTTTTVTAGANGTLSAPVLVIQGATSIAMSGGKISIQSDGPIDVDAGGAVNVNAGGTVTVNAGGNVIVKGGTVKLN
jgi:type VI secretion system secreted protein VgrG